MEEKFAASLKSEKEQLEVAFRERLREHELYEHEQRLVTAGVTASASTFGNCFSAQQFGCDDKGTETNTGDALQLTVRYLKEKVIRIQCHSFHLLFQTEILYGDLH